MSIKSEEKAFVIECIEQPSSIVEGFDRTTVEPQYSELMAGVICSGSEMFGLSKKKCTYANTAFGFPATRQSTVAMRQGGNVENITHNTILQYKAVRLW